jgi:hypothetical protein
MGLADHSLVMEREVRHLVPCLVAALSMIWCLCPWKEVFLSQQTHVLGELWIKAAAATKSCESDFHQ